MYCLNKKSIELINTKFNLPATGIEQDWEIELADFSRIYEFINFFDDIMLDDDDRIALLALILSSYDDYLQKNNTNIVIEDAIEEIVMKRKDLFYGLLSYWAILNEKDYNNFFKLTNFARRLLGKY